MKKADRRALSQKRLEFLRVFVQVKAKEVMSVKDRIDYMASALKMKSSSVKKYLYSTRSMGPKTYKRLLRVWPVRLHQAYVGTDPTVMTSQKVLTMLAQQSVAPQKGANAAAVPVTKSKPTGVLGEMPPEDPADRQRRERLRDQHRGPQASDQSRSPPLAEKEGGAAQSTGTSEEPPAVSACPSAGEVLLTIVTVKLEGEPRQAVLVPKGARTVRVQVDGKPPVTLPVSATPPAVN